MLARLVFLVVAIGLVLLAALVFDRFDPSRRKPPRSKSRAAPAKADAASGGKPPPAARLTPLAASPDNLAFGRALVSELRLLLKGQRWWWYAVAMALGIAGLARPPEAARAARVSAPATCFLPRKGRRSAP